MLVNQIYVCSLLFLVRASQLGGKQVVATVSDKHSDLSSVTTLGHWGELPHPGGPKSSRQRACLCAGETSGPPLGSERTPNLGIS